ncbi:haloacid dehalogenase type II [Psychromonas sp. PT13]|uniref:haloacid dehalogenase type II n=1 Tax=Psychromonas sp. PT13 TaxID=3439547 RepID=UPI003EBB491A
MIKAVFFDMNETMLNLSLLKDSFDKHFEDKYVLKYWFTKLLHTSTVVGSMNEYANFGQLSEAVLESLFHENGKLLTTDIKNEILGSFKSLPTYDDVPLALALLRKNGIKTIAVSNSSLAMIKEQLTNANIIELFDNYYSVDSVEKYKPFNDIYEYVANKEQLSIENIAMVASHDWDLFGAKKIGLTTAYIKRKEEIFNPYYPRPDYSDTDLYSLINKFIK